MKKIFCLLIIVAVMISMMPVGAYAATTTYYCANVENLQVETQGVENGFLTAKDNRQKVGSCYFYFDWDDTINIYCSKSKTGKAVNITKSTTSMRPGSNVIVGGKYVYYSTTDYDKNESRIYRIGTDGKGKKLIKTLKKMSNVNLIRLYNNNLYYFANNEAYESLLYKISLSSSKYTVKKLVDDACYSVKFADNLPSSSKVRYLYMMNENRDKAYVFDCKENKKIRTLTFDGEVGGMVVEGDRLYVYTTCMREDSTFGDVGRRELTLYSFSKTGKDRKLQKVVDNAPFFPGDIIVDGKLVYGIDPYSSDLGEEYNCWIYDLTAKTESPSGDIYRYIQLYGN